MSTIEETKNETAIQPPVNTASKKEGGSLSQAVSKFLALLSSVRFGVILLILLVALSMIGMLIMQQNVDGFDKYYAELQPSQKLLYGTLGFFDIYHAWYFNLLLLVLSLNIVLASIDRFPTAWRFIKHKKLEAGRKFLESQQQHAAIQVEAESVSQAAERVRRAFRAVGLRPTVTEKNGRVFVFGERGAWNRLGAYAVHVALLTIFTGGFLTAQLGREGQMPLTPGSSTNQMTNLQFNLDEVTRVPVGLPFTVTCTDIQQKLINKDGSIMANNTIDWLTRIRITDETGTREGLVHLNEPLDYRGYRFFQASFISQGHARNIKLRLTSEADGSTQEVSIQRNGSAQLNDGTRIDYLDFFPDFRIINGKPSTESDDYNNPAAVLKITTPAGQQLQAFAFAAELPSGAPVGAPVGGYKLRLVDFEKVPYAHILSVQKDPGKIPFYTGGALLILTLGAVFFFSHQRVWSLAEERADGRGFDVILGGNTNRNKLGFEDRFKRLVNEIKGQPEVEGEQS
ncbi:MAG: cytochrome c biogenesis protein ResB [Pyrinomonadaceae bacterium]|nr:cytochrome c biogenesis protein ResB [Pyrinomonadaceae bacterium]